MKAACSNHPIQFIEIIAVNTAMPEGKHPTKGYKGFGHRSPPFVSSARNKLRACRVSRTLLNIQEDQGAPLLLFRDERRAQSRSSAGHPQLLKTGQLIVATANGTQLDKRQTTCPHACRGQVVRKAQGYGQMGAFFLLGSFIC